MNDITKNKLLFIVTGTTRGLGKAVAERIIKLNYVLFEINKSETKRKNSFIADLSRPDQVIEILKDLSELIVNKYDKFILVFISNAATIEPVRNIGLFKYHEIVSSTNINFSSPIIISNAIAKLKNQSIIINITSGAANTDNEGLSLYSATKAGINRFISITKEEKNKNILHMCSFDPGIMDTDMQATLRKPNKYFKKSNDHIRLKADGKLNRPELIAYNIIEYVEEILLNNKINERKN